MVELAPGESSKVVEPNVTTDSSDATVLADGGTEQIRGYDELRHSDDKVRHYSADGYLYAYRDGAEHVVVSRGNEPETRWERRVPATRDRVVPGQQLWTIPDNWEQEIISKRDTIRYAIYHIPESDVYVKLSEPTNDHLVDAWYQVKAVGELDAAPVGELASAHELRQFADEYAEQHDIAPAEADADAMRTWADNWEVVEEDLQRAVEWVRDEGIDELRSVGQRKRTIYADEQWHVAFDGERVWRPSECISREFDVDDVPVHEIITQLKDADLIPDYYRFELSIDNSAISMDYALRAVIEAGASPSEAIDYCMTKIAGLGQTDWAAERGVDQSTISGNVSKAKSRLSA